MKLMQPVILFDGVCNLCNASVKWIIARDPHALFRFAALQSPEGSRLLAGYGPLPDSVVLVDGKGVHTQSTAALRIASKLGFPWSLAVVGLAVPRFVRDFFYKLIARHRYRWFGRQESCLLPTPELRARFLDNDSNQPK